MGGAKLPAFETQPVFSVASLWEITIKNDLKRADFYVNSHLLRRGLLENGYSELPIRSEHVQALVGLPAQHKDPFDRMLIAQSIQEGIYLLTMDAQILSYTDCGAAIMQA